MNKNIRKFPFVFFRFLLMIFPISVFSQQPFPINHIQELTIHSNARFPTLSADGRIVIQSNNNGIENIYLFNPVTDSTVALTADRDNEQHPVWIPGKEAIVYDKGHGGHSRLFYLNLKTGKSKPLLRRDIACREASFTPSHHLVAFSGFDDRTQHWQIYSYDFVYDNLNRLTTENGNCSFPVFSPDGKTIAFTLHGRDNRMKLKIINWYGGEMKTIAYDVQGKVFWTPKGWRILFVSIKGNQFVISSIRNDGTHQKELFSSKHPLCCPTLSPNGKELIFPMKKVDIYKIFTLQFFP